MEFSEGQKSGHKNRHGHKTFAIKTVMDCILNHDQTKIVVGYFVQSFPGSNASSANEAPVKRLVGVAPSQNDLLNRMGQLAPLSRCEFFVAPQAVVTGGG